MNEQDPDYASVQDKIPEDWQNNSTISYNDYYLLLNLEMPPLSELTGLVVELLEKIIEQNHEKESISTPFTLSNDPPIGLGPYVDRISKYSHCSPEVFILGIIYIDKYHRNIEGTCLKAQNVHK